MTPALDAFLATPQFRRIHWLFERLEGFRATPYKDSAGYNTVGYGHLILGCIEEDPTLQFLHLTTQSLMEGMSKPQAVQLLGHDLMYHTNIQPYFKVDLQEEIWTSLTSFCFNIGLERFQQSKAFKEFHLGNLYKTAESLSSWRNCEHMFSEGIAKRRLCEVMILLQKSLTTSSSSLPSQQLESPFPLIFTDDNWIRLPLSLKEEAAHLYQQYKEAFRNEEMSL